MYSIIVKCIVSHIRMYAHMYSEFSLICRHIIHSCQPVQPEFLDKESKFPGFYNISLDIVNSHDKMINSQKK